jgi:thiol:disulfide interchange protein DsbD
MMKRTLVLMGILLIGTRICAQLNHPVSWNFSVKKINGKTFDVLLKATMEPGWHLFS